MAAALELAAIVGRKRAADVFDVPRATLYRAGPATLVPSGRPRPGRPHRGR